MLHCAPLPQQQHIDCLPVLVACPPLSTATKQGPAAPEAAAAAAPSADQEEGKRKDKKKDKKGAAGLLLGKGSAIVRGHLEKALAAALPAAAAAAGTLGVVEGQLEAAAAALLEGPAGVDAVEGVLTSHEAAAVKMLEDVKVVVEANQARRKPKVCRVWVCACGGGWLWRHTQPRESLRVCGRVRPVHSVANKARIPPPSPLSHP